jgi:hypothetical protein
MLALRRVGAALLGFRRLPVSSCRPAIMTTQRGVKSSRSSKGTDTSSNTSSTSSTTGTTATRKRKGRDATAPINAAFFKVDGANPPAHGADAAEGEGWVVGEVTDHAIDLHDVRPVRKRCWSNGMTGEGRNAFFFFFPYMTWILIILLVSLPPPLPANACNRAKRSRSPMN